MGISVFTLLVKGRHFSALAGGVALAVMMIPTITRTTEEMLATVPTPFAKLLSGWECRSGAPLSQSVCAPLAGH